MFMPHTWNNGMMEYWNVEDPVFSPAFGGIDFKEIFSFMEFDFMKIFPINHCHIFPEPIIPSFQYSIIPIAKLSSPIISNRSRKLAG